MLVTGRQAPTSHRSASSNSSTCQAAHSDLSIDCFSIAGSDNYHSVLSWAVWVRSISWLLRSRGSWWVPWGCCMIWGRRERECLGGSLLRWWLRGFSGRASRWCSRLGRRVLLWWRCSPRFACLVSSKISNFETDLSLNLHSIIGCYTDCLGIGASWIVHLLRWPH